MVRLCEVSLCWTTMYKLLTTCLLFRVIFKDTIITAPLNTALWSVWNSATPNTDHVLLADFNTTGSGVAGVSRANFATLLSASQAASYSISSAVGSDYATWVDPAYLV